MDAGKLYLVFEFMDMDLKKYMDSTDGNLDPQLVQVRYLMCMLGFVRDKNVKCIA
jgi:cyclin-dependent kinase 1/cyclin-dependent kinase 3/cyclin-dependent kinase 2